MTSAPKDPRRRAEERVGTTLNGKWHLDRLLDIGGMGAVFAATHRNGKRVAVKVLHREFTSDPEIKRRFLREGYVANKIEHSGAVSIVDDDIAEDGSAFLVMELLEGESLGQMLERVGGTLPTLDVLAIAGQLLEVLGVAHVAGIVHRDIKPANAFITKTGYVKLLDFGLARVRDAQTSLVPTGIGIVMGTSGYMAPEQARGRTDMVDARSDLFAVGAVMFKALTGRPIHVSDNAHDRMIMAMTIPASKLGTVRPTSPRVLCEVVDKALAFEMNDRWQSAPLMFDALRAAHNHIRQSRRTPTPMPTTLDAPVSIEPESGSLEPSLVVDVTFGDEHEALVEKETARAREVVEGLSRVSIIVDDAPNPTTKRSP
jgi:serine/threonine protein kinase